jgi:hypothetical protein
VDSKLADLTVADGVLIGSGLAASLVSNTTSDAAVAEWISKYPALENFDELHAWFRPLMNTVGKRLLAKSKLGAAFRLYSGAGLSFMDMITDMSMIYQYMTTPGQERSGHALLTMVGLNILFQLVFVWMQARKGPRKKMVWEMLIVLSSLKPGIDAYRVAHAKEQPAYAAFSPEMELSEFLDKTGLKRVLPRSSSSTHPFFPLQFLRSSSR